MVVFWTDVQNFCVLGALKDWAVRLLLCFGVWGFGIWGFGIRGFRGLALRLGGNDRLRERYPRHFLPELVSLQHPAGIPEAVTLNSEIQSLLSTNLTSRTIIELRVTKLCKPTCEV